MIIMFKRLILFIVFISVLNLFAFAAMPKSDFVEDSGAARLKVLNYLHEIAKEKAPDVGIKESVIIYTFDFGLSLFFLWLGLFLNGIRGFRPKQYAWFLFAVNLFWFICLMVFRWVSNILDYLILNLRPDLSGVILDNLSLFIIFSALGVYIWLLARTFNLGFLGAIKVFIFSNFVYFLIIFVIFYFCAATENKLLDSAKATLGFKQAIHGYLGDLGKVSSGADILSFFRPRLYHL